MASDGNNKPHYHPVINRYRSVAEFQHSGGSSSGPANDSERNAAFTENAYQLALALGGSSTSSPLLDDGISSLVGVDHTAPLDNSKAYEFIGQSRTLAASDSVREHVISIRDLFREQGGIPDDDQHVYIGRANIKYQQQASIWQNPFREGDPFNDPDDPRLGEPMTHEDVIDAYAGFVLNNTMLLEQVGQLRGKILVTFDSDQGHVLAQLADLPDQDIQTLIDNVRANGVNYSIPAPSIPIEQELQPGIDVPVLPEIENIPEVPINVADSTLSWTKSKATALAQYLNGEPLPDDPVVRNALFEQMMQDIDARTTDKGKPLSKRAKADILGVSPNTVTKWETEIAALHRIPDAASPAPFAEALQTSEILTEPPIQVNDKKLFTALSSNVRLLGSRTEPILPEVASLVTSDLENNYSITFDGAGNFIVPIGAPNDRDTLIRQSGMYKAELSARTISTQQIVAFLKAQAVLSDDERTLLKAETEMLAKSDLTLGNDDVVRAAINITQLALNDPDKLAGLIAKDRDLRNNLLRASEFYEEATYLAKREQAVRITDSVLSEKERDALQPEIQALVAADIANNYDLKFDGAGKLVLPAGAEQDRANLLRQTDLYKAEMSRQSLSTEQLQAIRSGQIKLSAGAKERRLIAAEVEAQARADMLHKDDSHIDPARLAMLRDSPLREGAIQKWKQERTAIVTALKQTGNLSITKQADGVNDPTEDTLKGGQFAPLLQQGVMEGKHWKLLAYKVEARDLVYPNAHDMGLDGQPTLRYLKDGRIQDLYVDGMTTEQFLEATGLELSIKKGGFVLAKRLSRVLRPTYIAKFFPANEVKVGRIGEDVSLNDLAAFGIKGDTPEEQSAHLERLWDGGGVVSRDFLMSMPIPEGLNEDKQARLLYERAHCRRVEFTILTDKGEEKGHAIVSDIPLPGDNHFIVRPDIKTEVKLHNGQTFVSFVPIHAHTSGRLDIQTAVNLIRFFDESEIKDSITRNYDHFLYALDNGDIAKAMSHFDSGETIEDLKGGWYIREYLARGGDPRAFGSTVKTLLGQLIDKAEYQQDEKFKLPLEGYGRYYMMPESIMRAAGWKGKVERGEGVLDKEWGTIVLNDDDWDKLPDAKPVPAWETLDTPELPSHTRFLTGWHNMSAEQRSQARQQILSDLTARVQSDSPDAERARVILNTVPQTDELGSWNLFARRLDAEAHKQLRDDPNMTHAQTLRADQWEQLTAQEKTWVKTELVETARRKGLGFRPPATDDLNEWKTFAENIDAADRDKSGQVSGVRVPVMETSKEYSGGVLRQKFEVYGIKDVMGGADEDDAAWVRVFRDKADGEKKMLIVRSPNQEGERILLRIGEGSDVLSSRIKPIKQYDRQDYQSLERQVWWTEEPDIERPDQIAVQHLEQEYERLARQVPGLVDYDKVVQYREFREQAKFREREKLSPAQHKAQAEFDQFRQDNPEIEPYMRMIAVKTDLEQARQRAALPVEQLQQKAQRDYAALRESERYSPSERQKILQQIEAYQAVPNKSSYTREVFGIVRETEAQLRELDDAAEGTYGDRIDRIEAYRRGLSDAEQYEQVAREALPALQSRLNALNRTPSQADHSAWEQERLQAIQQIGYLRGQTLDAEGYRQERKDGKQLFDTPQENEVYLEALQQGRSSIAEQRAAARIAAKEAKAQLKQLIAPDDISDEAALQQYQQQKLQLEVALRYAQGQAHDPEERKRELERTIQQTSQAVIAFANPADANHEGRRHLNNYRDALETTLKEQQAEAKAVAAYMPPPSKPEAQANVQALKRALGLTPMERDNEIRRIAGYSRAITTASLSNVRQAHNRLSQYEKDVRTSIEYPEADSRDLPQRIDQANKRYQRDSLPSNDLGTKEAYRVELVTPTILTAARNGGGLGTICNYYMAFVAATGEMPDELHARLEKFVDATQKNGEDINGGLDFVQRHFIDVCVNGYKGKPVSWPQMSRARLPFIPDEMWHKYGEGAKLGTGGKRVKPKFSANNSLDRIHTHIQSEIQRLEQHRDDRMRAAIPPATVFTAWHQDREMELAANAAAGTERIDLSDKLGAELNSTYLKEQWAIRFRRWENYMPTREEYRQMRAKKDSLYDKIRNESEKERRTLEAIRQERARAEHHQLTDTEMNEARDATWNWFQQKTGGDKDRQKRVLRAAIVSQYINMKGADDKPADGPLFLGGREHEVDGKSVKEEGFANLTMEALADIGALKNIRRTSKGLQAYHTDAPATSRYKPALIPLADINIGRSRWNRAHPNDKIVADYSLEPAHPEKQAEWERVKKQWERDIREEINSWKDKPVYIKREPFFKSSTKNGKPHLESETRLVMYAMTSDIEPNHRGGFPLDPSLYTEQVGPIDKSMEYRIQEGAAKLAIAKGQGKMLCMIDQDPVALGHAEPENVGVQLDFTTDQASAFQATIEDVSEALDSDSYFD